MTKLALALVAAAACGGGSSPKPTLAPAPPADVTVAPPETAPAPAPAPPPVTGHPDPTLIPRAALFGNPERAQVKISPDGKTLSWLAPLGGVMNIWVAPVGKLDQARALTKETTRPMPGYGWAETSKQLFYVQDAGGDENYHVFIVDVADGKTTDLTPYPKTRASVVGTYEKTPNIVAVQMNDRDPTAMDLYTIDLTTKQRTLVAKNEDHFAGFIMAPDLSLRGAAKKTEDGGTQILLRDKAGAWKPWDTIGPDDAETSDLEQYNLDGKTVFMTDSRGRDTGALVSVDVATKAKKVIAEDPRADAGRILWHPTKHTPQAVAFEYDRVRWTVLDKSIKKDLDNLSKIDGGEVEIVSRTRDDRTWIVASETEQHPGRYYIWDRAKQKATFLFSLQPALDNLPLVKMWPVEIKTRDGLTMMSYLSLPKSADPDGDGKANTPVPTVLFVHGGPWGRDSWGYHPYHQLLANRGYAVLSMNFRGSTGFGKKFLNAGNLQWSKAMHDDVLDAAAWTVAQNVAIKDKIAIAGGSYGGYETLVGLTFTPEAFACGVDIVGPSNLNTLLGSIPPYWKPILAVFAKRMGDPSTEAGKAILAAASPLTKAAQIKRPLLIGQGANDPRVKQAESEQIVSAMKQHGLPVTYVVFPDEGHGFHRPENNIAFWAITEAFLSAHLGGSYLPFSKEELAASTMKVVEGKAGIPGL